MQRLARRDPPALPRQTPLGPTPPVIDADYVLIEPPGPGSRSVGPVAQQGATGFKMLAPIDAAHAGRRGGAAFWSAGLALASLSFWLAGGHALAFAPVSPADRQDGLRLTMLESGVRPIGGREVLAIEAEVSNASAAPRRAPPVTVLIVTGENRALRYALAPEGAALAPGKSRRFASRLPAPRGGVRSLSVAFGS